NVVTATVLVNARAGVEGRRVDVGRRAVGGASHDDVAAAFEWPAFHPVDAVAGQPRFEDSDARRDNEIGGDRGAPGAVRSFSHSALSLPQANAPAKADTTSESVNQPGVRPERSLACPPSRQMSLLRA